MEECFLLFPQEEIMNIITVEFTTYLTVQTPMHITTLHLEQTYTHCTL